jgi:hypothetical protein
MPNNDKGKFVKRLQASPFLLYLDFCSVPYPCLRHVTRTNARTPPFISVLLPAIIPVALLCRRGGCFESRLEERESSFLATHLFCRAEPRVTKFGPSN